MGVVDEDGRTIVGPNKFQPAFSPGEFFQRREHARRLSPGRYRDPRRNGSILHLKGANKRQSDLMCSSAMGNRDNLCKSIDGSANKFYVLALLADRNDL